MSRGGAASQQGGSSQGDQAVMGVHVGSFKGTDVEVDCVESGPVALSAGAEMSVGQRLQWAHAGGVAPDGCVVG